MNMNYRLLLFEPIVRNMLISLKVLTFAINIHLSTQKRCFSS